MPGHRLAQSHCTRKTYRSNLYDYKLGIRHPARIDYVDLSLDVSLISRTIALTLWKEREGGN